MNGVSLALDCFVVGKAVSALSDLTKPTLGQIIKLGGRTLAVDALTYGASYGTTAVLEDTNLPNELKLLLSLGVGLTVSHVSGKYLIKSADGNVISEVDEKTLKRGGAVEDVIEGTGKPFSGTETAKLLDDMPKLSGTNREKLLSVIQDDDLSKIANELYRPAATVGDGGTAAKLTQEFYGGSSKHLQKSTERLKNLNDLIESGNLGLNDLDIAEALRDDLENAINLFK